jgi:hypothetical protein
VPARPCAGADPGCTVDDVYLPVGALSATIRTGSGDWRRRLETALAGLAGQ